MPFPALGEFVRSALSRFTTGSEPVSLQLSAPEDQKSLAGGVSFDAITAGWYARNGYPGIYSILSGGMPAWSGEPVSVDTALMDSVVYACNKIISETVGFIPLSMLKRQEGSKEVAVDHPMQSAVKNAPTDDITAQEFRETLTSHTVLSGNGFARVLRRSGTGVAYGLQMLVPSQVMVDRETSGQRRLCYRVKLDQDTPEKVYYVTPNQPQDILHVRGIGWDGSRGYSVVQMGRQSIGTALAMDRNVARFFANGGRLPYVLEMSQRFRNDEDFKKFRSDWEATYSEPHRAPILENGTVYKQIGLNMNDMQLVQSRQFAIAEVCRWFSVSPHLVGDLSRSTFCLPGESEVFTDEGPRRIDQVRVGDKVWSRGGQDWVLSTVSRSACTGHDEILTIKTTNRTIRLNARHRVLARVKRLACVHAQVGQPINPGQHPVEWSSEWVPAGTLMPGDTIVNLQSLPAGGVDEIPSGREASLEFLEFCGLLLGDGNVTTVHGEPVGVQIARGARAPYMDHYRQSMTGLFCCSKGNPVRLTEEERTTKFKSVRAARELAFLGLSGVARTKRVPGWVFGMSEPYRLALLRGFLDADGSVDKKGRIAFSSCNRDMLSQMRHLCMSCGIPVTNLRIQRGQTKLPNGKIVGYEQANFTCSDPGANLRIGSHTPIYVERMNAGAPFNRKSRNYPRYGGRTFQETGCEPARISSIERSALHEPVYDLEVAETHSFIADGVVVHNSNIEQLALEFVKLTLSTWLNRWEQALWRCVLTPEEKSQGYFFRHDINALLRGDFQSRMQGYATMLQNGLATVNEVRDLEDWNPAEGGDDLHIQLNMQTLPKEGGPLQGKPGDTTTAQPGGGASPSTVIESAGLHAVERKIA